MGKASPRNLVILALLAAACSGALGGCGGKPHDPAVPAEKAPALSGDLFVSDDQPAGDSAEPADSIRPLVKDLAAATPRVAVTVDYPLEGSVFPPEIVAPTFLWHDADNTVNEWLVELAFSTGRHHVYALTRGARASDEADPQCVTETNLWRETPYDASAKGWTPAERVWALIKQHSVENDARVAIYGVKRDGPSRRVVSKGSVTIRTSKDPAGAPIFYRDVPLMPTETESGVIQPIAASALPMIQWRLRDLSQGESRVVMQYMPTCANCHSFSRDGKTVGMDMDGPGGDKGAYALAPVATKTVLDPSRVFSWNSFKSGRAGNVSYGMFPQVSPDGRHVVATILETLYVRNYADYRFLQTFYPAAGVLAVYAREAGEIRRLPGADDPAFVQSNPAWSPDGKTIAFLRAPARAIDPGATPAKFANDPNELQIRYDIYTIPFNEGKGGVATPLRGASMNGMSNSFPKYSPDGRWIVFVQCKNGLLMRPDSKLYILPAAGGEPRLMRCNMPLMNSWHSWSPNGRWLVFSSKSNRPYTQMFLTHVDENGVDTPPVLVPHSTAANRAVNLPEFANLAPGELAEITAPAVEYRRVMDRAGKLLDAGKTEEAIAELRRSIAMKGDYAPSHSELATVLGARGRNDEAVAHYERAIAINPNHFFAHLNLAIILTRMGRAGDAVEHCRRAAEINPDYYLVHNEWGTALCAEGKDEEALGHYRKVLAAEPGQFETLVNAGALLVRMDRAGEAIELLERAVKAHPESFPAHMNLALALGAKGDVAAAAGQFEKALEINPLFAPARLEWARMLLNHGRAAEAVERLRKGLERAPQDVACRDLLARVYATHPDAAVRSAAEAVSHAAIACDRAGRDVPQLLDTLAAACAEAGRFDDASVAVEKALALARQAGNDELARSIEAHLKLFREKKPLRTTGAW